VRAADDAVALLLELVGQLVRFVDGLALDPDFPGRVALLEELLLDVGAGRLVVPAVLLVQPVFDLDLLRGEPELVQLGFDDLLRLASGVARGRVDETVSASFETASR
jgi:hypothetical protein